MNTILENARICASLNWKVFPLKPRDKIPTVRWLDVCTDEINMINGWWEYQPDANVGIACGKKSGIVVVDIDAGHGGYESLAALIEQHGALPKTPVAKTGGGGEHIFFSYPDKAEIRNSTGRLGPGIDLRAEGGYVVGAGSVHPNGNIYEWVIEPSIPLAEFPSWMIELLKDTPVQNIPVATNGKIANGARNQTLTQLAGAMRRKGLSEDAMYQALLVHNRENCMPPLTDGEVLVIARSVSRYTPSDPVRVEEHPTIEGAIDALEAEVVEREKNPRDVWGIHYTCWPFLSLITGGKQLGELIIDAGEPGVGKSWMAHQDALFTAMGDPANKIDPVPVLLWSGEMRQRQVLRRMFEMLGVPKRKMLTGKMDERSWQKFNEAKALLMNSPLRIIDSPLDIKDLPELLRREIGDNGIQQAVFDYDWLISARGDGEIETSQNISRTMKNAAHEFNISIVLLSSVNKGGMGGARGNISNVSGSGKKLHDADIVFKLTKFDSGSNDDLSIMPSDYDRIVTLNFEKARDLDYHLPGGKLNFMRETPNPRFRELKRVTPATVPSWIERADIGD